MQYQNGFIAISENNTIKMKKTPEILKILVVWYKLGNFSTQRKLNNIWCKKKNIHDAIKSLI